MAHPTVLFGPDSEPYNDYPAVSPAPANYANGNTARLHRFPLGQQLVLRGGSKFRFAAVGGATLVIGDLLCGPVATASQQNLTAAAGAVGDRLATMTTGASSVINTFAEGFLNVSVAPGAGQIYQIASHALMTTGAGDIVYFSQGHTIRVATTVDSKYDLIQNNYKGVLQVPVTTVGSAPMGVALKAVTTLRGTWIQTRGVASVLGSGTLIAGDVVAPSIAAGAVSPIGNAEQDTAPPVGYAIFVAATAAWSTIFLRIDG